MKRNADRTNAKQKRNVPQCSVVVRRLSLGEIARMTISPFFISNECGGCQELVNYGPKCTTCSMSYHYTCALHQSTCCDLPIFLHNENSFKVCSKCKQIVNFGPSCSICNAKYHHYCITPYDRCCRLNICDLPRQRLCHKCETVVVFGPRCPICKSIYHIECAGKAINCCGISVDCNDDSYRYKCKKCCKITSLGSLMCQLCGEVYHFYCIGRNKMCCGKPLPLEIFYISSFKAVVKYFKTINNLRSHLTSSTYKLRNSVQTTSPERMKKKSISSQTEDALDRITIVSVKSEVEQKEEDIPGSPPFLEREMNNTPEPSSSCSHNPGSDLEDDTLKSLFDFLYNLVKKFPPQLQTQVKIDLFKTVTEAEMKLRCNVLGGLQNNAK